MEYDWDFNAEEKKINKCLLEAKDLKLQKKLIFFYSFYLDLIYLIEVEKKTKSAHDK